VPKVAYAHNDADAMRRFVIDVLGYRDGNIIDLRDATKAQLEATFGNERDHRGKLFDWVRPGRSDVMVFYSGHGVPGARDHRGYLLPVDADAQTPELNGYPVDLLYANLSKLEANSIIVFIDACFTGESPQGTLVKSASPVHMRVKPATVAAGLTVITAAQADQLASWDDEARHGLFTRYLLDALYGAADSGRDGNRDGTVTLGEVQNYLDDEMTYAARRNHSRTQNASVTGDAALTLVAKVPAGDRPELPKPAPVAAAPAQTAPAAQVAMVPQPGPAPVTTATAADPSVDEMDEQWVATRNANVRDRPDVQGAKVGSLAAGQQVNVTGEHESGEWLRVALADGTVGYVYAELLAPAGAGVVAPQPANVPAGPGSPAGQLLAQGNARLQAGDAIGAEQAYRTLLGGFPQSPEASDAAYLLGRSMMYQGNLAGAVPVLEQAYAMYPEHPLVPGILLEVGQAAIQVNNYPLACLALVEFTDVYEGPDVALLGRVQQTVAQLGCN
jgi:TolA-binding protein